MAEENANHNGEDMLRILASRAEKAKDVGQRDGGQQARQVLELIGREPGLRREVGKRGVERFHPCFAAFLFSPEPSFFSFVGCICLKMGQSEITR
jgi:hypothetical protein